jgi:hypothetical protein
MTAKCKNYRGIFGCSKQSWELDSSNINRFKPKFTITNHITAVSTRIEWGKGFVRLNQ